MHLKVFDEVIDGFVYGAALSIGFATLENVQHLPNLPFLEQLARTATLPLTHTLFAAMWGLAIAWGKLRIGGWKGVLVGIGGVVGAILLHGFYDFIIFQWAATWATTLIAIALWGIVIFACRREAKLVMERKKAAAAAIGRALREAARGAGDG